MVSEAFSYREHKRSIASLRLSCRHLNELLGENFRTAYLKHLTLHLSHESLEACEVKSMHIAQYVKKLVIDTAFLADFDDDPSDDPWQERVYTIRENTIELLNHNVLGRTLTRCLHRFHNLQDLCVISPFAHAELPRHLLDHLEYRASQIMGQVLPAIVRVATHLKSLQIYEIGSNDLFYYPVPFLANLLHTLFTGDFASLKRLQLTIRLSGLEGKTHFPKEIGPN